MAEDAVLELVRQRLSVLVNSPEVVECDGVRG